MNDLSVNRRSGFTLVEIMIVVAIIGLLAAIAIPSFMKSRENAQATAIANDFRIFSHAFQQFAMDTGNFPGPDWTQGSYPAGMTDNWLPDDWIKNAPVGGYYVFHNPPGGPPLVLLNLVGMETNIMSRVDEILDDGNLSAGAIRGDGSSLDYYFENEL